MQSKRTVTRKGSDELRDTVRELSRTARAELKKLLKRNQAGTITRVELDTGLKEVKKRLKRLGIFTHRL